MIRFTEDKYEIISCWQEAFGDTEEDILFFIENVRNAQCIAYYYKNDIAGMMYLVESNLGKYVYAACTKKKYQKRGIMTSLLDYCKERYNKVCLIPANEDLINYYKKRDFSSIQDIDDLKFNQIKDINEYLFEGCELKKPVVLVFERKN